MLRIYIAQIFLLALLTVIDVAAFALLHAPMLAGVMIFYLTLLYRSANVAVGCACLLLISLESLLFYDVWGLQLLLLLPITGAIALLKRKINMSRPVAYGFTFIILVANFYLLPCLYATPCSEHSYTAVQIGANMILMILLY